VFSIASFVWSSQVSDLSFTHFKFISLFSLHSIQTLDHWMQKTLFTSAVSHYTNWSKSFFSELY